MALLAAQFEEEPSRFNAQLAMAIAHCFKLAPVENLSKLLPALRYLRRSNYIGWMAAGCAHWRITKQIIEKWLARFLAHDLDSTYPDYIPQIKEVLLEQSVVHAPVAAAIALWQTKQWPELREWLARELARPDGGHCVEFHRWHTSQNRGFAEIYHLIWEGVENLSPTDLELRKQLQRFMQAQEGIELR